MIVLRQNLYATAASFKPKFRNRFRNGDFSYVPAKDPRNEMLNHQAYKEVACEDEFKNNPETYKIRQGLFSEKISESDRKKLERARNIHLAAAAASEAGLLTGLGIDINRMRHGRELTSELLPLGLAAPGVAASVYRITTDKKMYKKYHPEVKKPKWKEVRRWVGEETGVQSDIKQKKEGKEGKK